MVGVILLISNEFLRKRLSSLKLLISLYAFVTLSFFTLFLSVVTGFMNTGIFLLGVVLSTAVGLHVVALTFRGIPNRSPSRPIFTCIPAIAMIGVLTAFYFLNWIPPVPLSVKFAEVYHKVKKTEKKYQLTLEKKPWYKFWKESDGTIREGDPAYCFTAVFASVSLNSTSYHHWQQKHTGTDDGENEKPFVTTDRISTTITGGREEGYRGYTVKQNMLAGEWRVDVETEGGKLIGRVPFDVEKEDGPPTQTIPY